MSDESPNAPRWLDGLGKFSAISVGLLALDFTYEQTILTWAQGEQMVGFSISHIFGPLILLAILAAVAFITSVLVLILQCLLRNRPLPRVKWMAVIIVIVGFSILLVPYRFWKRTTLAVLGPGPRAAQSLVFAAHDGDRSTVELLLNHGVPVDTFNATSTALNGACAGGQVEMARFLLSKGADVHLAPDCQRILKDLY